MKVVIQCAGKKSKDAGSFRLKDGRKVIFVASPSAELPQGNNAYTRPDDMTDTGHETWREKLVAYNRVDTSKNPLNLFPAYKLYMNSAYQRLVSAFGEDKIFILSAGWGLIPAHFLTPLYDITFSASSDPLNRRKPQDHYKDFSLMEDDGEAIAFLGGKSYLPLFLTLTGGMSGQKTIFYSSQTTPHQSSSNIKMIRFKTSTRTNWHYECAHALAEVIRGIIVGRLVKN